MLDKQEVRKADARRSRETRAGAKAAQPSARRHGPETRKPPGYTVSRYFTRAGRRRLRAASSGSCAPPASAPRAARRCSSRRTSRSPSSGARPRPTWWCRSTSAASSGTPGRERSVRQLINRVADTITAWGDKDGYFADKESAETFRAELKHLLVQQKMSFNSPVWFNVGIEAEPQCSACFINSVDDTMESILGAGQDRGHAVQVRLGHRHQPVAHPLVARVPQRRRHRLGPGQLHARLRRLRRRHQVGRQDPARGQDGHPQHRPPRRRGVHLVQGQGREEGLGADRRRLRRLVRRRGLQVGLLPELEQLGARHRRLHGGGAEGPRLVDPGGARRPRRSRPRRRASCGGRSPRRPGSAAIPACSTTPRSTPGTPRPTRRASTPPTRAPSTCTSTTRPATWRR